MTEQVYIISTKSCADRRKVILNNIKNSNILSPIIFSAKEGKPGWVYCGLSHLALINHAKAYKLPYIIVFEDDTKLIDNFDYHFSGILQYIKHNNDWDIFNGNPTNLFIHNKIKLINKNPNIVRFIQGATTNCMIYSERSYDRLLSLVDKYNSLKDREFIIKGDCNYDAFDLQINKFGMKIITSYPYISTQLAGHSSIENKFVDYSKCTFEWGECVIKSVITPDLNKKIMRILDSNFSHDPYSTHNQISKFISWYFMDVNNISVLRNKVIFFTDLFLDKAKYTTNCKCIAWLLEPMAISPSVYKQIQENKQYYDCILTHNKDLVNSDPKFKWYPVGGTWVKPEHTMIYPKSKMLNIIASSKKCTVGHQLRHEIIAKYSDKFDVYGYGYHPVANKLDALKDYYFQIVIENSICNDYFTEKIGDCFATGIVPIYWGTQMVVNYFDKNGIIMFNNIDDLDKILSELSVEKYNSMKVAIENNLKLIEKYRLPEDWIYYTYPEIFEYNVSPINKPNINLYSEIWNAYTARSFNQLLILSAQYLSTNIINNLDTQYVRFFNSYAYQSLNWNQEAIDGYSNLLKLDNIDDRIKVWCEANLSQIPQS